jgi:hypothetical protein
VPGDPRRVRREHTAMPGEGLGAIFPRQVSQIASVRLAVGSGMLTSLSPPDRAIDLGSAHCGAHARPIACGPRIGAAPRYHMETTS